MQLRALRSAHTFDAVACLYERAHVLRRPPVPGARSVSPHHKPFVTVRLLDAPHPAYALRYHDTDVVIWERRATGDYVTVTGWSSMSTETFAEAYTPWNVRFDMHHGDGFFVKLTLSRSASSSPKESDESARCYEFDNSVTLLLEGGDADIALIAPGQDLKTKFIDPSPQLRRSALIKENYFAFSRWVDTVLALEGRVSTRAHARSVSERAAINEAEIAYRAYGPLGLLADPNKWMHFIHAPQLWDPTNMHSVLARRDQIKRVVMDAIYCEHKAVIVRDVEWYPWSQHDRQRALRSKYHWAVY